MTLAEGIKIEFGNPDDAGSVAQVFFEDMTDLGVEPQLSDLEALARSVIDSTHSATPDCLCIVARLEHGGAPVGVTLVNFNWSLKFAGRSLWIETLYVTPAARRRSIGRFLAEYVLSYAYQHGMSGIDLEAYQGNTPASILYRSLGFHRLGRERFYYRIGEDEYL